MDFPEGDTLEYGLDELARDEPISYYISHKGSAAYFTFPPGTNNRNSRPLIAQNIYPGLDNLPSDTYTPQRWVQDVLLDASATMDPSIIRAWQGGYATSIQADFRVSHIQRGWARRFATAGMNQPLWRAREMGYDTGYMLLYLLELVIKYDLASSWNRAWVEGRFDALLGERPRF